MASWTFDKARSSKREGTSCALGAVLNDADVASRIRRPPAPGPPAALPLPRREKDGAPGGRPSRVQAFLCRGCKGTSPTILS